MVSPVEGELRVRKDVELDRETTAFYNITVTARDLGSPSRNSSVGLCYTNTHIHASGLRISPYLLKKSGTFKFQFCAIICLSWPESTHRTITFPTNKYMVCEVCTWPSYHKCSITLTNYITLPNPSLCQLKCNTSQKVALAYARCSNIKSQWRCSGQVTI